MIHCEDSFHLTSHDLVLSCTEFFAAIALAVEDGLDDSIVLRASDLMLMASDDQAVHVSLCEQHVAGQSVGASGKADSGVRMATRLRLTAYSIVGLALRSSATLDDAIRICNAYAPLLNLKFALTLKVERDVARLGLKRLYQMEASMLSDCVIFELAKIKVLLDNVLCSLLPVLELVCSSSSMAASLSLQFPTGASIRACESLESDVLAEIRFDASVLERALPQSHARTHQSCTRICDSLMGEFSNRYDLERHVRSLLRNATGRPPTPPEIAKTLCLSERTLRRRLAALNTSYNQILDDTRKELAITYVTTTRHTTETIAELLGYSEAANFRHAFKRWTGKSPRHFCRQRSVATPHGMTREEPALVARTLPRARIVTDDSALHAAVAAWR